MRKTNESRTSVEKVYPISRAVQIAKAISIECQSKFPSVFKDAEFHGWDYLERFCQSNNIRIILNKKMPGDRKEGLLMYVGGHPFILIDRSINKKSRKARSILAHEICHYVLGHKDELNFSVLGFSETVNVSNGALQILYQCELEIEAVFASFMMIMPDAYLDRVIEERKFIPTRIKSRKYNIPLDWMAARVQLYREMYGYKRTNELIQKDPMSLISKNDLGEREGTDRKCLENFLPQLGSLNINSKLPIF